MINSLVISNLQDLAVLLSTVDNHLIITLENQLRFSLVEFILLEYWVGKMDGSNHSNHAIENIHEMYLQVDNNYPKYVERFP